MQGKRAFTRWSNLYMFLFSLRLSEAFWVIFLRSKGLSFAAIGLMETVFHLAALAGEVPTGWIADRIGRKTSLVAGRILAVAAAALALKASSPLGLGISFACSALGYTCHSGAYEALIYDEHKRRGLESDFTRTMGRINAIYLVGCSAASLLGGLAAQRYSLSSLYAAGMVLDSLAVLTLVPLRESFTPSRAARERVDLRRDFAELASIMRQPSLAGLLLLWAAVATIETSFRFYGQSHMRQAMLPLWAVGAAAAIGNLAAVVPTHLAHRFERRHGSRRPLCLGAMLVPAVVFLAGSLPAGTGSVWRWGLICLFVGVNVIAEGLYPIFCNAVNALVPSERRATALSAGSMLFSLIMIAVFPLLGCLGDAVGLAGAFLVIGGAGLAAGSAAILAGLGKRKRFPGRDL